MSNKKINLAIELIDEQREVVEMLKVKTVASVRGAAGTGKSATVFSYVLEQMLLDKNIELFIAKPPVQAIFDIGLLPGTIEDKTSPYHAIIFEIMKTIFIGEGKDFNSKSKALERLMHRVKTYDISFLRGITFPPNSIVVLEEFQNMPLKGLELLIGRVGRGAKLIMIGDEQQTDVKRSGIHKWIDVASRITGVGDIVLTVNHRDPVALEIVKALQE